MIFNVKLQQNYFNRNPTLLLIVVLAFIIRLCNTTGEDEWFYNEMQSKVVPHYVNAYETLKHGIIEPILKFNETLNKLDDNQSTKSCNETQAFESITVVNQNDMLNINIENVQNKTEENIESHTNSSLEDTVYNDTGYVLRLGTVNEMTDDLLDLINQLNSSANDVHESLDIAVSECEKLRTRLKVEIESVTSQISNQEHLVRQLDSNIAQLASNVSYQERQVLFIEQLVREREISVRNTERELHDAEERVERARLCRGKRLIGGWWRKHVEKPIVRAVQDVIVKPVCSVVNMGGIDNAKDARSLARNMLNEAGDRLSKQRAELAQQQADLLQLRNRRTTTNHKRELLSQELSNFRAKQLIISALTTTFMEVSTHLASVLASSKHLTIEIRRLVDFELVINPLNSLANDMLKNGIMTTFELEISASTIIMIDDILVRVTEKLSELSIVLD